MSYVRDNGLARQRRRRERRSMAILAFCGLLVVGAIVFAVAFVSQPTTSSGPCPNGTVSVAPPAQSLFVTNVYNAGGPAGTAARAATALKSHSLQPGVIGNDPLGKTISGVGEVRFGPDGESAAKKYVAVYVPGATLVNDGRDGDSVDVVLGKQFPTIPVAASSSSPAPHCK